MNRKDEIEENEAGNGTSFQNKYFVIFPHLRKLLKQNFADFFLRQKNSLLTQSDVGCKIKTN